MGYLKYSVCSHNKFSHFTKKKNSKKIFKIIGPRFVKSFFKKDSSSIHQIKFGCVEEPLKKVSSILSIKEKEETTYFLIGDPYVGPRSVFLHILVVALYSLNLNWSLAVTMKCSFVIGGYHVRHCGTALCSIRSELVIRKLSFELFSKSYSTYRKKRSHDEVRVSEVLAFASD